MGTGMLLLTVYFCLWAAMHSLLASIHVKRLARQVLGEKVTRWYRLGFNAIAMITAPPMLVLPLLMPGRTLYVVPPPWRWLMVGGQILALLALIWTLLQTAPLHFLGLTQLLAPEPSDGGSLLVRGLYCYVRHPLYMFSLFLIWLTPVMSVNLLALYILMTIYFYVGSIHEEKRLLVEFGPAYQDYRQRVPRLIPRLKRCYPPSDAAL